MIGLKVGSRTASHNPENRCHRPLTKRQNGAGKEDFHMIHTGHEKTGAKTPIALLKSISKESMAILSVEKHTGVHCRSILTQIAVNGQSRPNKKVRPGTWDGNYTITICAMLFGHKCRDECRHRHTVPLVDRLEDRLGDGNRAHAVLAVWQQAAHATQLALKRLDLQRVHWARWEALLGRSRTGTIAHAGRGLRGKVNSGSGPWSGQ